MLDRNAAPSQHAADAVDLLAFARSINTAAADPSATRWGRKVLISALVEKRDLPRIAAMLVAANRAGLIQLARVDHCPAEYHASRSASEINAGGATYHAVIDMSIPGPWEVRL